jgi:UDP-hydrolysing UDP-N-acetyl-D-glucosamine 2-epimerase
VEKKRIAAVVTNRASYARVRSLLLALRDSERVELQLILAASLLLEKYGQAADVIEQDGFDVAARVYMVLEGENPTTMAKTAGVGMLELATLFDNLRPSVVLTVADRYETIATAVTAAYLNIPVAHVQGGEISGSIDERVRHAVTKLSDVHFVSNERSAARIVRMGEHPNRVFVTGCPSIDLAAEVQSAWRRVDFDAFAKGVGATFDLSGNYLIVMQHPVTTEYARVRHQIEETLHAVEGLDVPAFWFWPNVDAGSDIISKAIRSFREKRQSRRIHFLKNLPPTDFLKLLVGSSCLVGNSSAAIRECSYLGVPAVNIGTRQHGRDRASNVRDVDHDRAAIERAIAAQIKHGRYPSSSLYGDGRAGVRIAGLLEEIDISGDKVWFAPVEDAPETIPSLKGRR